MPQTLNFDDVVAEGLSEPVVQAPPKPPLHPDLKFDDVLNEGLQLSAPESKGTKPLRPPGDRATTTKSLTPLATPSPAVSPVAKTLPSNASQIPDITEEWYQQQTQAKEDPFARARLPSPIQEPDPLSAGLGEAKRKTVQTGKQVAAAGVGMARGVGGLGLQAIRPHPLAPTVAETHRKLTEMLNEPTDFEKRVAQEASDSFNQSMKDYGATAAITEKVLRDVGSGALVNAGLMKAAGVFSGAAKGMQGLAKAKQIGKEAAKFAAMTYATTPGDTATRSKAAAHAAAMVAIPGAMSYIPSSAIAKVATFAALSGLTVPDYMTAAQEAEQMDSENGKGFWPNFAATAGGSTLMNALFGAFAEGQTRGVKPTPEERKFVDEQVAPYVQKAPVGTLTRAPVAQAVEGAAKGILRPTKPIESTQPEPTTKVAPAPQAPPAPEVVREPEPTRVAPVETPIERGGATLPVDEQQRQESAQRLAQYPWPLNERIHGKERVETAKRERRFAAQTMNAVNAPDNQKAFRLAFAIVEQLKGEDVSGKVQEVSFRVDDQGRPITDDWYNLKLQLESTRLQPADPETQHRADRLLDDLARQQADNNFTLWEEWAGVGHITETPEGPYARNMLAAQEVARRLIEHPDAFDRKVTEYRQRREERQRPSTGLSIFDEPLPSTPPPVPSGTVRGAETVTAPAPSEPLRGGETHDILESQTKGGIYGLQSKYSAGTGGSKYQDVFGSTVERGGERQEVEGGGQSDTGRIGQTIRGAREGVEKVAEKESLELLGPQEFDEATKHKPYLVASVFTRSRKANQDAESTLNSLVERAKRGERFTPDNIEEVAASLGQRIVRQPADLMRGVGGLSGAGKIELPPSAWERRIGLPNRGKLHPESIGTVFHEIGHDLLHTKTGMQPWKAERGKPIVRGEWASVEQMLGRSEWAKNAPYYTQQTERYARLFALYFTRNAALKEKAPVLYSKIERLILESVPAVVRAKTVYSRSKSGEQWTSTTKRATHEYLLNAALEDRAPVSASAVDAYGIKLPAGYVREGDRYVYRPESITKPSESITTPAESAKEGFTVGQKVRVMVKGVPKDGVIEEVLPQETWEREVGEQGYKIKVGNKTEVAYNSPEKEEVSPLKTRIEPTVPKQPKKRLTKEEKVAQKLAERQAKIEAERAKAAPKKLEPTQPDAAMVQKFVDDVNRIPARNTKQRRDAMAWIRNQTNSLSPVERASANEALNRLQQKPKPIVGVGAAAGTTPESKGEVKREDIQISGRDIGPEPTPQQTPAARTAGGGEWTYDPQADGVRWQRRIDAIHQGGLGGTWGARQKGMAVQVSSDLARNGEFGQWYKALRRIVSDVIPVKNLASGGAYHPDTDTVFLNEGSPADVAYFAQHEGTHVNVRRGDADTLSLLKQINRSSPMYRAVEEGMRQAGHYTVYQREAIQELGLANRQILSTAEQQRVAQKVADKITEEIGATYMGSHRELDGIFDNPQNADAIRQRIRNAWLGTTSEPIIGVGAAAAVTEAPTRPSTKSIYDPEFISGYTVGMDAYIDNTLARRGQPPRTPTEVKHDTELMRQVDDMLKVDSQAGENLRKELAEKIRPLSDAEQMLLTREMMLAEQLENEAKSIDASLAGKTDPASNAERAKNAIRMAAAMERLTDISMIDVRAGTEWGRSGRARQLGLNEQMELARMRATRKVLNNGRTTGEQDAETLAIHNEFKDILTRLNERLVSMPEGPAKDAEVARLRKMLESVQKRWKDALARDKVNGEAWVQAVEAYLDEQRAVVPEATKARILSDFREAAKIPDATERDAKVISLINEVNSYVRPKGSDWFDAYLYTNLLSSPRTWSRNIVGNFTNTYISRPLALLASGRGGALKYLVHAFGSTKGAAREAIQGFLKGAEGKFSEGLQELPDNATDLQKRIALLEEAKRIKGPESATGRVAWKALRATGSFQNAQDVFFYHMIRTAEAARLIDRGIRPEVAEIRASKLANEYLYRDPMKPISDVSADPTSKSLEWLGHYLDKIRKAPTPAMWRYPMKMVVPFLRTIVKIAEFNTKTSILGFRGVAVDRIAQARYGRHYKEIVNEWMNEHKKGAPDTAKMNELEAQLLDIKEVSRERMGRAAIGTAFMLLGFLAAANGMTIGAAPKDKKRRALFYDAGLRENSTMIGGVAIPHVYFGPAMLSYAIGPMIFDILRDNPESAHDSLVTQAIKVAMAGPSLLMSQLPLTGLNDLLTAVNNGEAWRVKQFFGGLANELMPLSGLSRWLTQLLDPTIHRKATVEDTIKANIPILSKQVEAIKNSEGIDAKREIGDVLWPWTIGTLKSGKLEDYKIKTAEAHQRAIERQNKAQQNLQPVTPLPKPPTKVFPGRMSGQQLKALQKLSTKQGVTR